MHIFYPSLSYTVLNKSKLRIVLRVRFVLSFDLPPKISQKMRCFERTFVKFKATTDKTRSEDPSGLCWF